jgi:hypothetical protein
VVRNLNKYLEKMRLFRKNKDVKSQIEKAAKRQTQNALLHNKFIPAPRKKLFTNLESLLASAEEFDKQGDVAMSNFFLSCIVERINVEPK